MAFTVPTPEPTERCLRLLKLQRDMETAQSAGAYVFRYEINGRAKQTHDAASLQSAIMDVEKAIQDEFLKATRTTYGRVSLRCTMNPHRH